MPRHAADFSHIFFPPFPHGLPALAPVIGNNRDRATRERSAGGMISYAPLWGTMKRQSATTYTLQVKGGISSSTSHIRKSARSLSFRLPCRYKLLAITIGTHTLHNSGGARPLEIQRRGQVDGIICREVKFYGRQNIHCDQKPL